MRICLISLVFLTTATALWAAEGEVADVAPKPAAKADLSGAAVTVIEDRDGSPILWVRYPWACHEGASIEICLFPPKTDVAHSRVEPLYFTARHFRGDVRKVVERCEDHAANVLTPGKVCQGDREYAVLGNRNTLGVPAVAVGWETTIREAVCPHVSFGNLQTWATESDSLYLNLPPEQFCRPGILKIWLLRGETIVWQRVMEWPDSALGPWKHIAEAQDAVKKPGPVKKDKKPVAPAAKKGAKKAGAEEKL
jgi:hypothetical protein